MDHLIDIGDEQKAAATLPLPDDVVDMIGKLIEYSFKRVTAARIALRQKQLAALRGVISLVVVMLILLGQLVARSVELATYAGAPARRRANRHLHHPPQAWAAP